MISLWQPIVTTTEQRGVYSFLCLTLIESKLREFCFVCLPYSPFAWTRADKRVRTARTVICLCQQTVTTTEQRRVDAFLYLTLNSVKIEDNFL